VLHRNDPRIRGTQVATVHAIQQIQSTSRASTIVAALFVALFGVSLIWAAGFTNADALHNAAHDSRHSLVFPCH